MMVQTWSVCFYSRYLQTGNINSGTQLRYTEHAEQLKSEERHIAAL